MLFLCKMLDSVISDHQLPEKMSIFCLLFLITICFPVSSKTPCIIRFLFSVFSLSSCSFTLICNHGRLSPLRGSRTKQRQSSPSPLPRSLPPLSLPTAWACTPPLGVPRALSPPDPRAAGPKILGDQRERTLFRLIGLDRGPYPFIHISVNTWYS